MASDMDFKLKLLAPHCLKAYFQVSSTPCFHHWTHYLGFLDIPRIFSVSYSEIELTRNHLGTTMHMSLRELAASFVLKSADSMWRRICVQVADPSPIKLRRLRVSTHNSRPIFLDMLSILISVGQPKQSQKNVKDSRHWTNQIGSTSFESAYFWVRLPILNVFRLMYNWKRVVTNAKMLVKAEYLQADWSPILPFYLCQVFAFFHSPNTLLLYIMDPLALPLIAVIELHYRTCIPA
ncbi:hypothetical protein F5890DRAFT_361247 [Lentinula detonsa]|uniref:Uncharacterized protein n=1 Tax=Lentinula detonsa TaxID=2804962 RepID=A0AA38PVJ8_9AGAR|nr:hypothetical protein F5890DRAFT_361247 [Lentinula detonsa]